MMPLFVLFFSVVVVFLVAAYLLQRFLSTDNTSGPDDHYFEEKMADSDGA